MNSLDYTCADIFDSAKIFISDIIPSAWYEQNMIMPEGSSFPGPFSFNLTPFWREPLDCSKKDHPAKEISVMKGAQLGGTAAVLNPLVGYTISQNPGNIMFLTGHSDLTLPSVIKLDQMIDNCGIRKLIRPNVLRAKNSRTGDTNTTKEFFGGTFYAGSVTNHNLLRQYDIMIMVVDDYDAAAMFSKNAGSTRELVQKRCSAYSHKKKIYYVSSPQLSGMSNIQQVFALGDQRYYNVPCPCCNELIVLKWSIKVDEKETAGITWKVDSNGRVDKKSVGYICQKCAGFFDDTNKYEMNLNGIWVPTCVAIEEDHWSYQISSLYAPPGMDDWAFYVNQYLRANPDGQKPDQAKNQTFVNTVLGEPYEKISEDPKANEIQQNIRNYEIGIVPEKLSIMDGNGKIILLTCACDLNGTVDDARLDYEVLAWSESGASYSITHGSIGTFVPREGSKKYKEDRERWSYEHSSQKRVWSELNKILDTKYEVDTGRKMKVFITGVDCGHFTVQAYTFIDNSYHNVIGVRGKPEHKYIKFGIDMPTFSPSKERGNLYMVEVGLVKDDLSELMKLKYDSGNDDAQPPGFMNFPTPSGGKYLLNNYFSHFESESRKIAESKEGQVSFIWQKKTSTSQNHFWDVRVYNIVIRDILVSLVGKEMKIKSMTWKDYVDVIFKRV